jgi:hypothetical protein
MIEIIIPANTSWESIFQYYTGKNITISDLVSFIESGSIHSKQKGGVVPGPHWVRLVDTTRRLVSVGANAAQGAAEGAAVGAAGGPAGALVGAVAGGVIQTALIEGAAAMISTAAGPAAPIAQRTIATALSIGVALVYAGYTAWLANQPAEGILEQQGGATQDSMYNQISEIIPVIDALKKSLGNDFDLFMEIILIDLKKSHPVFPKRVFSIENIFTGVSAQLVFKMNEKFKNTKIRSKTRKNRK